MSYLRVKLNTWAKLGLFNVMMVGLYRVLKRLGYYRFRYPIRKALQGPFLSHTCFGPSDKTIAMSFFSYHVLDVESPPDWFINRWNRTRFDTTSLHWSQIDDFMQELGDIKTVWELSRFDWLPKIMWAGRNEPEKSLGQAEFWLQDWTERNPPQAGINWKCGQEASFRCLNLLLASLLTEERFEQPLPGFLDFLEAHLKRIRSTIYYALTQDNNHGISEASALFLAGHYLATFGDGNQIKQGQRWATQGRCLLENRVKKLIMTDGSFSQHSLNYHRLMLDVLSFTELIRRRFSLPAFSSLFYGRLSQATLWLHIMTDSVSGDGPNLGANDGALLFNLDERPYRDLRPAVQLAAAVFLRKKVWADKVHHPLLTVFGLDITTFPDMDRADSQLMKEGGYARLENVEGFALMRLPVYRFRPAHADAHHVDIWHRGINLIRDAGSFSYHGNDEAQDMFQGTAGHSTAGFDNRNQMPRLSRFLFGAWLKPDDIYFDAGNKSIQSSYTDFRGAKHQRLLQVMDSGWRIEDEISGFDKMAVLRWLLAPGAWILDGRTLTWGNYRLTVESEADLSVNLKTTSESRYYLEKTNIPVLEVRAGEACRITTVLSFEVSKSQV